MDSIEIRNNAAQAWEAFMEDRPFDRSLVRDVIFQSWTRSKNYGINPYATNSRILSEIELQQKLFDKEDLVLSARSYLENLYRFIKEYGFGSDFYVVLTDEEGYILTLIGDSALINEAGSITQAVVGCSRNENAVGTNAMGLCLFIDQPIQTLGEEHYLKTHHRWTCSAAPIHDENGKITGCVNITASHKNVHPHTLGMVVAAVDGIEKEMKMRKAYNEIEIINKLLAETLESLSSCILVINENGEIKYSNKLAKSILNISNPEEPKKNINDIFNFTTYMDYFLSTKKNINDAEISINIGKGSYDCTMSVSLTCKNPDKIDFLVITLKDMKAVRKLVHKMIGSQAKFSFQSIIGESKNIKAAIHLGKIVAPTPSNVLLLGESGTGKELFSQSIHNDSNRRDYPFVAINCGALPRGLIESELFGYESGSFTGAKKEGMPGKFELANGGTLFLDEIGDMPYDVQVSLLRVLQNKEVVRIGGNQGKKIDVRIIAATNKNLQECVDNKSFREDLYFRLNVFPIIIPPLRERPEDIRLLSEHLLSRNSISLKKGIFGINDDAIECLEKYSWPGNVRELENIIERALTICDGKYISPSDLPDHIVSNKYNTLCSSRIVLNKDVSIQSAEKALIIQTLERNKGNIKKASEDLGINRRTLYNKLQRLNISYDIYREV